MGPAFTQAFELITTGRLAHDGDPVLAEHVANTTALLAERGMKVTKPRRVTPRKNDAAVALVMAVAMAMQEAAKPNGLGWVARDNEASYSDHMPVTMKPLTDEMRAAVLRLAAQHGARDIRVFGSVARGEAGTESDLDLLVDFEPGRSLLDQVALTQDLETLLGRPIDVVTEDGLYWLLRRRILGEARPL